MLCVTLTLTRSVPKDQAAEVVGQLVTSLSSHPDAVESPVAGFKVHNQEQVQGCLASAHEAVGFILSAARSGFWGIHLTVLPGKQGSGSALSGPMGSTGLQHILDAALTVADEALRAPGQVLVAMADSGTILGPKRAPQLGFIESSLQLLSAIERRRSHEGQEAGVMINAGKSQSGTASELGVSQQAVSARLRAGYWYESRRAAYWLAHEIQMLIEA